MNVCNKLECHQSSLMFVGILSSVSLYGELLSLPTNIWLSWQDLPGTNTLAYYKNSQIMYVIFYNIGPEVPKTFYVQNKGVFPWQTFPI
jgi:hypothetical protein